MDRAPSIAVLPQPLTDPLDFDLSSSEEDSCGDLGLMWLQLSCLQEAIEQHEENSILGLRPVFQGFLAPPKAVVDGSLPIPSLPRPLRDFGRCSEEVITQPASLQAKSRVASTDVAELGDKDGGFWD